MPIMKDIREYLPQEKLEALRAAYDHDEANEALAEVLPDLYHEAQGYVTAISATFYDTRPPDCGVGPRGVLSAEDRERCLIALLTSRRERLELGLHVYLALMELLTPEEIANIMLLAGIYTGVDNFSGGLMTERATLEALASYQGPLDAPPVLQYLAGTLSGAS